MSTEIQWTEETWNIWDGCTKISSGCAKCYIERTPPFRIAGRKFVRGHIPLRLHEDRFEKPVKWKTPRMVFVNSLSDFFHEHVPDAWRDRAFATMAQTPHTYQILTKRADRLRAYSERLLRLDEKKRARRILEAMYADHPAKRLVLNSADDAHMGGFPWPLPNVWFGVSVENQRFAETRIPELLRTPAAVRFISAEPLLGSLSFRWASWDDHRPHPRRARQLPAVERDGRTLAGSVDHLDGLRLLDWVIVGGESGPGSRACQLSWIRSVVKQCRDAEVPCFVKQLGAHVVRSREELAAGAGVECPHGFDVCPECDAGSIRMALKDKKGGEPAEWPKDLRLRQFPTHVVEVGGR